MKIKMKLAIALVALLSLALMLTGCDGTYGGSYSGGNVPSWEGGDSFEDIVENDFTDAKEQTSSTFSLDVNTASYSYIRRAIEERRTIDRNSVRIEEMINYFHYDYPAPEDGKAVSVTPKVFDCPWNDDNLLLSVGVRTEAIEIAAAANNLVFLIDTSGSMYGEDRLGLIKFAFLKLLENLTENDRVSIVTYAGRSSVAYEGGSAANKAEISRVIGELEANGSTNGKDGIQTAYKIAEKYFIEGGNNRVVLATDGDFNVGINSPSALKAFVSEKSSTGVYLTVLGFGQGNYKDSNLEALAKSGQGNYAYIDSRAEAYRLFSEAINGTLKTVARDAKAQVVFNPETVKSYRLIGYENKMMSAEDWDDDDADAGELGSGLTVTALYEISPALPYSAGKESIFATASVRYKNPDMEDTAVREVSADCMMMKQIDDDAEFIAAVAEFGLILRNSKYRGTASVSHVLEVLQGINLTEDVYKSEFLTLVTSYKNYYKSEPQNPYM